MANDNIQRLKHQELWHAVELNNQEKVTSYLDTYEEKSGEELKEAELYDHTGNSIIHKAASLGHAEVLMLLLERTGATPDLVNASLATPLHLSCKNDRLDASKFLIGCGVDANMQDEHGQVPLLICCIHGHFDQARLLIEANGSGHLPEPLEVDLKDHRGLSPLNCAAIKGDFDMTKLLVINGGADIDGASPKGCTPLLYGARGGYAEVVRFLLLRGASPLRQDNAGGTVLHHAIEKGHMEVLGVLLEHGVDVHSAIEIPDNAGRTPIYEAIDNHETPDLLLMITKSRKQGGFDAKVNITNYNGQTPLFSAAREGNIDVVRALVEQCDARLDLTQGELYKEEFDDDQQQFDSLQEKFFMDAYKNCMTPLHVAVVLGYENIMLYLIEKGANPNLQTKIKGFSCLHLAVLSNKPEIIIELLTKTQANPYLPDFAGRTLQDMVEIFIPSYLESFKTLLENLQCLKTKGIDEESLGGLAQRSEPVIARHYYNPDDERSIQGLGTEAINPNDLVKKAEAEQAAEVEGDKEMNFQIHFHDAHESEIQIEEDANIDQTIETVFGRKIAIAFYALDWKYKEMALKLIYKQADKFLDMQNQKEQEFSIDEMIKACVAAISLTSREKVIKVFSISLQLLSLLIRNSKIEKTGSTDILKNAIVEKNVVLKLLQKSEEGNTRITNKIHECLLDLSFNPEIGEALTSSFILQRINAHNRAHLQKQASKKMAEEGKQTEPVAEKIDTEASLGSYKGLLAQLALLYKFINSFGIASKTRGPLSVKDILKAVMPAIQHPNQDVRNASGKILLDVHKLSGCVTAEELEDINEKARLALLEKLANVEIEKNLNTQNSRAQNQVKQVIQEEDGDDTDQAEVPETISTASPSKIDNLKNRLEDLKQIIAEKGQAKEWQEKEIAFKAIQDIFQEIRFDKKDVLEEKFLQECVILLKNGLEENNMTIYLLTVQVGSVFFGRALESDVVSGSLSSLVLPIILRTTDTNTRVRKKSVELINQIWDHKTSIQPNDKLKINQLRDSQSDISKTTDSMCQIIAQVICDPSQGEKAIIGRLGLFIKRATMIEGKKDLVSKPLQVVIGKNYEQLTEFACQWISHKNTKVRQNALKLIVEVCRINCMDPRGIPFKQRIVNYIMALRPSQRDPLIVKINDVCRKHIVENTSPGRAGNLEAYIEVNELDLGMAASKGRAVSMDHVGAKRRLQSGRRPGSKGGAPESALPSIGMAANSNPGGQFQGPTIVLPICEALNQDQINTYQGLIDFFGLTLITCFVNKNWSNRLIAIQKVEEQLYNLDPNRRDAMSAEINLQNMPVELNFSVFLEFMFEGLKDPVLKNYIQILELFQKALPTFFRYIQPDNLRTEIMHLIREILRKCTDMKQKIRESSINFCLYLSHQSPVGPEYMVDQVLQELDFVQNEKFQPKNKESAVAQNFGNSQLISSCIGLLNDYQVQTKIVTAESDLLKKFMTQINAALKHSNPQVRKEAEKLFKTLYSEIGQSIESLLVDQKPQLVQKLVSSSKQEILANKSNSVIGQAPSKQEQTAEQKHEINVQRAQYNIRDQVMNNQQLKQVLEGAEEHLEALKLPNPKKRQKAIVEIKKAISKKIVTQMSQDKARELFEPLTVLMRQLLQDENPDIYLEALNLLKFIVGGLAPFLSTLDLHLMMGSFIGIIVQNTATSSNMRIQVSSDKVIVFFAKHQNIGPFVVAKEINKNLERINKAVSIAGAKKAEVLSDKKQILIRFYSILQLLLQQFSIVLCYQPEFYIKCLECIADSMNISQGKGPQQEGEEAAVKGICTQIINNLYAIDYKLLDSTVSKLDDLHRKTPLRKAIIEHESQQKSGKGYAADLNKEEAFVSQINPCTDNEQKMRDTAMSFASSTNRQSLFSPGSTHTMNGLGNTSQYDNNWGKINNPDNSQTPGQPRSTRRMMSLGDRRNPGTNSGKTEDYLSNHPVSSNLTQSSWRKPKDSLPSIDSGNLNKTGVLLPQIGQGLGSGGGPSYKFESGNASKPPAEDKLSQKFKVKSSGGAGFSSQASTQGGYEPTSEKRRTPRRTLGVLVNENNGLAANTDTIGSASQISWPSQTGNKSAGVKPPLYVPSKRNDSQNKKAPQYVAKTGFSSQITTKELPFEDKSQGIGSGTGFSSGGYVPSAATAQRQPSLGSGRPRSGRKQSKGPPAAEATFKLNNVKY